MIKYLTTVIIVCVTAISLFADNHKLQHNQASIKVECPAVATVGQRFTVTYELSYPENISDNNLNIKISPVADKASLLAGPSTVNSLTTNVINGKVQERTLKKWSYIFRADKAGTFTTPHFTIIEDGDTLSLAPVSEQILFIVDNNKREEPPQVDTTKIFLRAEIDKPTIQLGDSLVLSVALISDRSDITNAYFTKYPTVEDCYQELLPELSIEAQEVTIDHRKYFKWIIGKYKIIPLKKGTFRIDEISLKADVFIWEKNPADSFFEYMSPRQKTLDIQSESIMFSVE